MPPPRIGESPGRLGKALLIALIGMSCAAAALSVMYMVR